MGGGGRNFLICISYISTLSMKLLSNSYRITTIVRIAHFIVVDIVGEFVVHTNINNHMFCFQKTITTYLKAKYSLHTIRIYSF